MAGSTVTWELGDRITPKIRHKYDNLRHLSCGAVLIGLPSRAGLKFNNLCPVYP
jgi:hypothetical protein